MDYLNVGGDHVDGRLYDTYIIFKTVATRFGFLPFDLTFV
jgi:hypothetical protein